MSSSLNAPLKLSMEIETKNNEVKTLQKKLGEVLSELNQLNANKANEVEQSSEEVKTNE